MTINEYQQIIKITAVYPEEFGIGYCALGLAGESGEVAEKVKKLYRDNPKLIESIQNKIILAEDFETFEEIQSAIKKELGDIVWYVAALGNEFGITLEDIMETNYNKLIKRKETNTLHGSGDNREENA